MQRLLLLSLLCVILSPWTFAQITRGDFLLQIQPTAYGSQLGAMTPIDANAFGISRRPDVPVAYRGNFRLGLALTDRFLLGGQLGYLAAGPGAEEWLVGGFGRYYLLNRPRLGLYGQLSVLTDGGMLGVQPAVGIHLPEAAGLLFSPEVSVLYTEEITSLLIAGRLGILLNRQSVQQRTAADFGRRSWMHGGYTTGISVGLNARLYAVSALLSTHYFLTDHLALGIGFGTSLLGTTGYEEIGFNLGVGPRLYLLRSARWQFFTEARAGYQTGRQRIRGLNRNNDFAVLDAALGVQYFLTNHFALETGLGHRLGRPGKDNPGISDNQREWMLGVGVRFIMPRGAPERPRRTIRPVR